MGIGKNKKRLKAANLCLFYDQEGSGLFFELQNKKDGLCLFSLFVFNHGVFWCGITGFANDTVFVGSSLFP